MKRERGIGVRRVKRERETQRWRGRREEERETSKKGKER